MERTSNVTMTGGDEAPRGAQARMSRIYIVAAGISVVFIVLLASLAVWGSEMEFPTTVSRQPSSDGSIMLEKSLRDVTSNAIDDGVDWMTVEAAWLFDWIRNAVNYALVRIEGFLNWTPWPAVVVALALLSYIVGGRDPTCIYLRCVDVHGLHGPVGEHHRHGRSHDRGCRSGGVNRLSAGHHRSAQPAGLTTSCAQFSMRCRPCPVLYTCFPESSSLGWANPPAFSPQSSTRSRRSSGSRTWEYARYRRRQWRSPGPTARLPGRSWQRSKFQWRCPQSWPASIRPQ